MVIAHSECVLDCRNILDEGPIWDVRDKRLYWVDIATPARQSFDPSTGKTWRWKMPSAVGCGR